MATNLNLNTLRVFAAAARHANFQRAAEELHLSHGAVSQRIKQLEGDLGVVLFERRPRGVALTAQGQTYFAAVEKALSILTTATADLQSVQSQIVIHLGSSFASKWLMPRMNTLKAQFPGISLTTEIHDELLNRALGRNEIAFWPSRNNSHSTADHLHRLCELQLVAVCSPNFLRPDWPVDTPTLLTYPLLQDAHHRWERLIKETAHPGPYNLLNFDRAALAIDAAIQGHGVAIAPTYMVEKDVAARKLVTIWHAPAPSGEYLFLSWGKHHAKNRIVTELVNWIKSEFGAAKG